MRMSCSCEPVAGLDGKPCVPQGPLVRFPRAPFPSRGHPNGLLMDFVMSLRMRTSAHAVAVLGARDLFRSAGGRTARPPQCCGGWKVRAPIALAFSARCAPSTNWPFEIKS